MRIGVVVALLTLQLAFAQFTFWWDWPPYWSFPTTTATATTIDASGEYVANVFQIPRTGTITGILFHVATVTTAGSAVVSLETVNSAGQPSGTMYGGSSSVTVSIGAVGYYLATLGTAASATIGDFVAAKITWASGNFALAPHTISSYSSSYRAYNVGTPTKGQNTYKMCLVYSDGTYVQIPGVPLPLNVTQINFNSGSSPNEYGVVFRPQRPVYALGWSVRYYAASGANKAFRIYDDAGNVLASLNVNGAIDAGSATVSYSHIFIPSGPVMLQVGRPYRFTVVATNTLNTSIFRVSDPTSYQGIISAVFGDTIYETSRTGSGTWTDVQGRMISVHPLIADVAPHVLPVAVSSW